MLEDTVKGTLKASSMRDPLKNPRVHFKYEGTS